MAEVIRMPLLSDTMKEGVIAAWHKQVGDSVKPDDALADVETDKATMEVIPYVEGTLLYISPEKSIPVNGVLAVIGKKGEDYQSLLQKEAPAGPLPEKSGTTADAPNPATAVEASPAGPKGNPSGEIPNGNLEDQNAIKNTGANNGAATPPAASTPPAPAGEVALPKGVAVVRMPLLSDTMKEGKIVAWNKQVGDAVKGDDVLAEVETDKATMEVMGYADGTLLHIGVPAGEAAKINDIIAIVGPAGTDISAVLNAPAAPAAVQEPDPTKTVVPEAEKPVPTPPQPATATPVPTPAFIPDTTQYAAQPEGERIRISPLARRLAEEKGIAIEALHGSGDGGRIIKRDVDAYQPEAAAPAQQAASPMHQNVAAAASGQEEGYTDVANSQMRNIIAARLSESKFSAPHFYLRISVQMDKAMAAREEWNKISPVKISFNDLTIKAVAVALRQNPDVNVSWLGDKIRQYDHIHVGTAVATEGGGLVVPVVRFADKKSLSEIAGATKELIGKVRDKKIQPQDYSGNTFTISNLGMMDIDEFTAIINPPDACILAVGKIAETPVVEAGEVVVRNIMKLTLSCDHRAVDGAVGAKFLQSLKGFLENPVMMLV